MKKILLILSIFIFTISVAIADNHAIRKEGFFSKDFKITKLTTIKDPENKIILINNHGQNSLDGKQKDCTTVDQVRNRVSLVDEEINGKKIMVYNLCAHDIKGDEGGKWWMSKEPYQGKTKLDKRVEQNLELVEKLASLGVPRKQIFVTGHSCGGLTTLLFFARHPEKAGGGISYMQACFGKLSKKYKVKKLGVEAGLAKFKKKKPAQYDLREKFNNEILTQLKVPLLAFTHPKDPFEGLTSDWLDKIEGMNRIVISEDYKIDGKKCRKKGRSETFQVKDGHSMDQATCFQYYNPVIKEYIASRIK